jgi:S-adenosylmethionine uptake transporter
MGLVMSRSHSALPFLSAAAGIVTFSIMDAFMKRAAIAEGAYNAMLLRSAIAALMMLPIWLLGGGRWPGRAALKVHVIRAIVATAMAVLWFWGLVRTPMAEAIALSFIAPLITLYLAAVMLGEKIQPRAIVASLLGFAGVLIIALARWNAGGFTADRGWGIAAILVSAVLYAWNLILQRQQAQVADPREIALFQTAGAALILGLFAPWLAHWPQAGPLLDIAGGAALTVISLMLLSWGYARAEAQALVPIEYSAFIWAAIMGWLWFAEAVTGATLAGAVLIVIGCLTAARMRTEHTAL